jgi:hypothetical protein
MMGRFSVIIPAYNASSTIGRAIESVLSQSQPAHEIIVVDDGSTDDIAGPLEQYKNDIALLRRSNGGVSAARNTAIAEATGEFIVLIDADDEWNPTRLERIGEYAKDHPDIDIITTEARVAFPDGTTELYYADSGREFPDPSRQVEAILRRNFVFGGAAVRLAALERIGRFDVEAPHQSEYEGWVRLLVSGSRAGLVREPLCWYHRGAGITGAQLSANVVGTSRTIERVLLHVVEEYSLSSREVAAAQSQLARVRRTYTVADAVQAIRTSPSDVRRLALVVVRDRGQPLALRAKFAAVTVSPTAARLLRR